MCSKHFSMSTFLPQYAIFMYNKGLYKSQKALGIHKNPFSVFEDKQSSKEATKSNKKKQMLEKSCESINYGNNIFILSLTNQKYKDKMYAHFRELGRYSNLQGLEEKILEELRNEHNNNMGAVTFWVGRNPYHEASEVEALTSESMRLFCPLSL